MKLRTLESHLGNTFTYGVATITYLVLISTCHPQTESHRVSTSPKPLQVKVGTEVNVTCCFYNSGSYDSGVSFTRPDGNTTFGCANLKDEANISCSDLVDGCLTITFTARLEYNNSKIECSLYDNGNDAETVAKDGTNLIITENTKSSTTTKPTRKPGGFNVNGGSSPGEKTGYAFAGVVGVGLPVVVLLVVVLIYLYQNRNVDDGDGASNLQDVSVSSDDSHRDESFNEPSAQSSNRPLVDGVNSNGNGGESELVAVRLIQR